MIALTDSFVILPLFILYEIISVCFPIFIFRRCLSLIYIVDSQFLLATEIYFLIVLSVFYPIFHKKIFYLKQIIPWTVHTRINNFWISQFIKNIYIFLYQKFGWRMLFISLIRRTTWFFPYRISVIFQEKYNNAHEYNYSRIIKSKNKSYRNAWCTMSA